MYQNQQNYQLCTNNASWYIKGVATSTDKGVLADALAPITNLFNKRYSRLTRTMLACYYAMGVGLGLGALVDATHNSLTALWASLYALSFAGLVGFFACIAVAQHRHSPTTKPLEEDN